MAELFTSEDTTIVDPNKNYLEELVGEGKKFASIDDLARGKAEADLFIARITAENAKYKDEVEKRKTMEEVLDQIKQFQNIPPTPNTPPNNSGERDTDNLFDQSKVEAIVHEKLAQSERERVAKDNLAYVVNTLQNRFGNGFQTELDNRAKELGLGKEFLTNLAKEQPTAFLAMMGETSAIPPVASTARTAPQNLRNRKNWAYYEDIRRKDFNRYNTLQGEMFASLKEQGDDFYK